LALAAGVAATDTEQEAAAIDLFAELKRPASLRG
jgi:hypothetical protein